MTFHVDYTVNPDDPRAPPQDVWDRMTLEQRQKVVDSLPSEFPPSEAFLPQGDFHEEVVQTAKDALRRFFKRAGRRIYIAGDIPVYYPGEPMFAADLVAVLDVDPHKRNSWVVSREGKGLDLAIEVVLGDRRKDAERNRVRYARLGIREYFLFDRPQMRLYGFRLPGAGADVYQPVMPQQGYWQSEILGLDLTLKDGHIRFTYAGAPVPEADELISTLGDLLSQSEANREEAARTLEEERQAREAAEQRAQQSEQRAQRSEEEVARLQAELDRLRKGL